MSFILMPFTGGIVTNPTTFPAGSVSAPGLLFTGAGSNTGFYSTGANNISVAVNGSRCFFFNDGVAWADGATGLGIASNTAPFILGGSGDTRIYRDGTGAVGVRFGTAQQKLSVYNTESSSLANYERLALTGVQGVSVNLTAESLGTGSANLNIVATPKGTGKFNIASTFPLTVSGNGSYVQTGGMTFANLAAAATAGAGARSFITDGAANVYGVAAAGGGALKIPVYSDGANWIVG